MLIATLEAAGQVMITEEIRTRLGLQVGDQFGVETTDEAVILHLLPRSGLLRLRGAFAGPDGLVDELLEEHRKDRERENRERFQP